MVIYGREQVMCYITQMWASELRNTIRIHDSTYIPSVGMGVDVPPVKFRPTYKINKLTIPW